jgi:hypothetical protein
MSLLYAVEAWILAVLGWAWITLRVLIPRRPLAEELCVYSTLLVSTFTLMLCSVLRDRAEVLRAYLGFTLVLWTFLAYAIFDCLPLYDTGSRYVPDVANRTVLCCPNQDVQAMNRAVYFGGLGLFLLPSSVTLALQTVQVLVAGAAYVSLRESVWPGNGWGYSLAALLSTAYFARFAGLLEPPCPDGAFNTLFGLGLNYGMVFGFFAFALMLLILLDGMAFPPGFAVGARLFGMVIVTMFCISIAFASDGRGMLTIQVILLLLKAWLPVVWSIIESLWFSSYNMPTPSAPHLEVRRSGRRSVRWVVPIQTDLSQPPDAALPTPLVMLDPPADSASAKTRKKRM